jgi:hypothetical protein
VTPSQWLTYRGLNRNYERRLTMMTSEWESERNEAHMSASMMQDSLRAAQVMMVNLRGLPSPINRGGANGDFFRPARRS